MPTANSRCPDDDDDDDGRKNPTDQLMLLKAGFMPSSAFHLHLALSKTVVAVSVARLPSSGLMG